MAIVAYLFLVSPNPLYNISVGIVAYNAYLREVWSYEFIQLSYLYLQYLPQHLTQMISWNTVV